MTADSTAARLLDLPVPLWRSDVHGHRIAVNAAWLALCGRDEAAALGEGFAGWIHPDDVDRYLDAHRAAVRGRTGFELEYRLLRGDGELVWLLDRAVPVTGPDGDFDGHTGASTDVTELKRVEAELREAQKLEAIERLAGGVAHGFNNLLTTVLGYAELVFASLPADDARRTDLAEIRSAAERGAALTQQLLALGQGQTLRPAIVDVNDVARDAVSHLERLVGPGVEVRTSLRSRRGLVRVDRDQLDLAILSLGVNARDAMPAGGTLTLETADDDTSVLLAVSDTGIGMDEDVKARLFEPFFTTKGPGAGAGLGLASVHGLVRQSGGRIEVDSEPMRGARFTIFLPKAADPDADARFPRATVERAEAPTVLVAEDEPSVRRLAEQILAQAGYLVFSAPSGEDALGLFLDDAPPVDVLVTDIVMPGMSGLELAERLTQLQPALGVVYISGYADESELRRTGVRPAGFLAKPFTPGALLARVERALAVAAS